MNKEITLEEVKKKFNVFANKVFDGKMKKMPKKEYEIGFDLLGDCIFPEGSIPFNEELISNIGPEFISSWIVKNWHHLDSLQKKLFFDELSHLLSSAVKCRRFFIVLACEMLKVKHKDAIIPLSILLRQKIKGTKDFPLNKEIISWIRALFFKNNQTNISNFSFEQDLPNAKKIALYSIAAAFIPIGENKKRAGLSGQINVLKWVCNSGLAFELPEYLHQHVRESDIAKEENIDAIITNLPDFPGSIIFGMNRPIPEKSQAVIESNSDNEKETSLTQMGKKVKERVESQYSEDKKESFTEEKKTPDNKIIIETTSLEQDNFEGEELPKGGISKNRLQQYEIAKGVNIEPIEALNVLGKYIQDYDLKLSKKELETKKHNKEKRRLLIEIGDLKHTIEKQKGKQNRFAKQVEQLKAETKALQSKLVDIKKHNALLVSKNQKLNSEYENEKQTYKDELKRLSRKIEVSTDNKRTETLNRLAEALKNEYQQLSQICKLDMSIQNGEKLRSMVKKIFSKIENEGVQFIRSEQL